MDTRCAACKRFPTHYLIHLCVEGDHRPDLRYGYRPQAAFQNRSITRLPSGPRPSLPCPSPPPLSPERATAWRQPGRRLWRATCQGRRHRLFRTRPAGRVLCDLMSSEAGAAVGYSVAGHWSALGSGAAGPTPNHRWGADSTGEGQQHSGEKRHERMYSCTCTTI